MLYTEKKRTEKPMSQTGNRTKSLLIRRIIAIVLSAAAILGLFLPMLSLSREAKSALRRVKTEDSGSCRAFIEDLPAAVTRILKEGEADRKIINNVEDALSDLVNRVALPLYDVGADYSVTYLEVCRMAGLPAEAIAVLNAHEEELDDALREFGASDPVYEEQEQEIRDAVDALDPLRDLSKIASYVLYGLLGLTLLFGALSIVMALLNRTKTFHVLFCVFAFLLALLFVLAIVGPRLIVQEIEPLSFELEAEEFGEGLNKLAKAAFLSFTTLMPGIGLILLPLCALAACILYKRDRSYAGVLPKREKKAAPVQQPPRKRVAAPAPSAPVRKAVPVKETKAAYMPPVPAEESYWTCPACGQQNDAEANFCCNCGAKKPQPAPTPQPAARFCPVCGRELTSAHKFCPGCGTPVSQEEQA